MGDQRGAQPRDPHLNCINNGTLKYAPQRFARFYSPADSRKKIRDEAKDQRQSSELRGRWRGAQGRERASERQGRRSKTFRRRRRG
eukprot:6202857-Pleurochrysis_carterae.AAC.1